MATILSDLFKPALRRAGVTLLPGIIPNSDKYTELIGETNRLLASWNCDGHKIYTTSIVALSLVAGQKAYTIGSGGYFNTPRPIYIERADLIWPTDPELRTPIKILDDDQWASIAIQDISSAPVHALYYDNSYSATGLANIYVYPQPPAGYELELYVWEALKTSFTAPTDAALFPPGYEHAIVTNLAVCALGLYGAAEASRLNANQQQALRREAAMALDALKVLNSNCPVLNSEAANLGGGGSGLYPQYLWLTGGIR